jgi:hypothetical protein
VNDVTTDISKGKMETMGEPVKEEVNDLDFIPNVSFESFLGNL